MDLLEIFNYSDVSFSFFFFSLEVYSDTWIYPMKINK